MAKLLKVFRGSVEKACESAMLAVEIYNKPAVKFKSGGYVVLMIIAWTAALHGYFLKMGTKPCYKDGRRYKKRDGDYEFWELAYCLNIYKGANLDGATIANLKLFIQLRNHFEHKQLKEIDTSLFGECQALLLNFDRFIELEFGVEHCIRESLSFSLQLFPGAKSLDEALKHNPATKPVVNMLQAYRSNLSQDVYQSDRYAFKAFLIKVANHQSADSVAIKFINFDDLTTEEKKSFEGFVTLIKTREVPVTNLYRLKASDVVAKVQAGLGNRKKVTGVTEKPIFNVSTHARCWKKYEARPETRSAKPELTKPEWCSYDEAHRDYLYTKKWVDYLILKMNEPGELESLFLTAPSPAQTPALLGAL